MLKTEKNCFHLSGSLKYLKPLNSQIMYTNSFPILPLILYMPFPEWAQEQHKQDCHNMSSARNSILPVTKANPQKSAWLSRTLLIWYLFMFLLWYNVPFKLTLQLWSTRSRKETWGDTLGLAHKPKSINFKFWSSSIKRFS